MNVTEWPAFIVSLDEIEFIHFERVSFALKNFDMVCIYKDYAKKVTTVTSIPMTSLDQIKDWLNSSDIRYTEGIQSLNWAKVLKTVTDDPVGFFEQGGWVSSEFYIHKIQNKFLSKIYFRISLKLTMMLRRKTMTTTKMKPSTPMVVPMKGLRMMMVQVRLFFTFETIINFILDDSDDYSSIDESDSGSEEELGSSEESGKDWDELEAEAMRDDKNKERDVSFIFAPIFEHS